MSVSSEHELETFLRVQQKFGRLFSFLSTTNTGRLCEALDRLSSPPFIKFDTKGLNPAQIRLSIGGENAGTFAEPDLYQILQKSAVSPFGMGEQWITDLAYRNGREISGDLVEVDAWAYQALWHISRRLSTSMFAEKDLAFKLHKMAVYTAGGHFDWHLDTTHSNEHQATMLLALNTSWEGGDLLLRRSGVEMRADMQPTTDQNDPDRVLLQAVAFYTDTEHKIEPVTKGARIVLQFDVMIVGSDNNSDEALFILSDIEDSYFQRSKQEETSIMDGADFNVIENIVTFVREHLQTGEDEVAFGLQHLYRKSSILPMYLKGCDALLYRALVQSGDLDVSLHPVVLVQTTDYDGQYNETCVYVYDEKPPPRSPVDRTILPEQKETVFHLNHSSAIILVHSQDFCEHRGNEPEPGEFKYFGGGMFVRLKKSI